MAGSLTAESASLSSSCHRSSARYGDIAIAIRRPAPVFLYLGIDPLDLIFKRPLESIQTMRFMEPTSISAETLACLCTKTVSAGCLVSSKAICFSPCQGSRSVSGRRRDLRPPYRGFTDQCDRSQNSPCVESEFIVPILVKEHSSNCRSNNPGNSPRRKQQA